MKKVSMYTLSTCPWCRKAKKYFTEHGIPFEFIDYDLADGASQDRIMRELDAAGANGFPFVRIRDKVVEERGTLEGTILTCAMHCAQFDVTTGETLSGPVPPHLGDEIPPPRTGALLKNVGMQHIRTESIRTYEAKVESEWVLVAL